MKTGKIDRVRLNQLRPSIERRLLEFASVPKCRWIREVLFCLLTPQSTPFHAEQCLAILENDGLFEGSLSASAIEKVLRTPHCYVRFHRSKAVRIVEFLEQRDFVNDILGGGLSPFEERERFVRTVKGLGWKESSHALRNIGRTGLTILDRHILRNLQGLGVIDAVPGSMGEKRYKEIEQAFLDFASSQGESVDVLDLFFWTSGTGVLFK